MNITKPIRCIQQLDFTKYNIDMLESQVLSPNLKYFLKGRYFWDVENNQLLKEFDKQNYVITAVFSSNSKQLIYVNQIDCHFYLNSYRIEEKQELIFKLNQEPYQIILRNENEFIINHSEGFDIYSLDPIQLLRQIRQKKIIHYDEDFVGTQSTYYESKNNQFSLRYIYNLLYIYYPKTQKTLKIIYKKASILDIMESVINNWIIIRAQRYIYILNISTLRLIKKKKIQDKSLNKSVEIKGENYNVCLKKVRCLENYQWILTISKLLPTFQEYPDRVVPSSNEIDWAEIVSSSIIVCNNKLEKQLNIYQI